MKKILFPTDFSPIAQNAFEYAKNLAAACEASLTALHVYHFEYMMDTTPVPIMQAILEQRKQAALEGFKQYMDNCNAKSPANGDPLNLHCELRTGFAIDEIVAFAKESAADMVVMGTKGATNLPEEIFGSITSNVVARTACSVLAVPATATYRPIRKIAFAVDSHTKSLQQLAQLLEFAHTLKAEIHGIHINDGREDVEPQSHLISQSEHPFVRVTFTTKYHLEIAEGLRDFVRQNDIDLLAVVFKHRSLWGSLFHHSVSKDILLHTNIPILALHE